MPEQYPDYILGWMLVVNPSTSTRIVSTAEVKQLFNILPTYTYAMLTHCLCELF